MNLNNHVELEPCVIPKERKVRLPDTDSIL
jgi:hypothetical protein